MIKFSLLGETILEWNDKDIEHYHARRMAMDISASCSIEITCGPFCIYWLKGVVELLQ